MMRSKFDEQLELLNVELITMGALCEDAISTAAKGLLDGDIKLARTVIGITNEIDEKERAIENLCMKLLLHQHPVARDLREISAALKMISDMERIGDQAGDIAEIATFIGVNNHNIKSRIRIDEMARATIKMVTDSIESYVKKDLELAVAVVAYDDVVDNLFTLVRTELIQFIETHTIKGELAIDLLMASKYLERIGDHAANIAEWVEFSLTGKRSGGNIRRM